MKFDGDLDAWRDFTKTVQKLEYINVYTREVSWKRGAIKIHEIDEVAVVLNRIEHKKNLIVEQLRKNDIKKFKFRSSIDLHGCTREVDNTLATFCAKCILKHIYEIIIITGKGQGIVKSATSLWLETHPEFVIGFFEI